MGGSSHGAAKKSADKGADHDHTGSDAGKDGKNITLAGCVDLNTSLARFDLVTVVQYLCNPELWRKFQLLHEYYSCSLM
jgi:hypothetical protein